MSYLLAAMSNDDKARFVPYPNDWRWFVANSGDLKVGLGGKRPSHGEGGTDKEALVLQTHALHHFMIHDNDNDGMMAHGKQYHLATILQPMISRLIRKPVSRG